MSSPRTDGYSVLYHVSPERNFMSIHGRGLLVRKAQGKMRAIWLATRDMLDWAIGHVAQHQDADLKFINIWQVVVATSYLRKHRKGIYLCRADVPRHQIFIVR